MTSTETDCASSAKSGRTTSRTPTSRISYDSGSATEFVSAIRLVTVTVSGSWHATGNLTSVVLLTVTSDPGCVTALGAHRIVPLPSRKRRKSVPVFRSPESTYPFTMEVGYWANITTISIAPTSRAWASDASDVTRTGGDRIGLTAFRTIRYDLDLLRTQDASSKDC